ncbi:hypothetical protein Ahy_B10g102194 [Arachis hypogaea]|uniref:Aminotransferase-like plant mobile domain-containing protein n=1 Tax=Arachis hypogaea TaxID=3818 RepID=A0A444X1P5_ARAHY|nr:hypothetical protein Ahy_B10g102194 [Arachis hypogaea]
MMACQAGNNGDINRLNETSHYAGTADFERLRLLLPRRVSHTLPPPDVIILYLDETGFGDTVPPQGLHFRQFPDFDTCGALAFGDAHVSSPLGCSHYHPAGRGATAGCQASSGSTASSTEEGALHVEAFVAAGSCSPDAPTDDSETLRQYARCYIMLLIGGYLMTDKSNNLVHIHWLPFLRDFGECRVLSWGSVVLAWMYQSLCSAAQRGITDIAGCTSLLMSWIYQRFPQWCPPDREIYQDPLAARLVGLQQ